MGDDQGYDPATYWSQDGRGHDGSTFSEEEREDWRIVLEDMTGEGERADWRRSLYDMVSDGWRVVRNNLAPHRPEEYQGPDHPLLPVEEPPDPDEVPAWMGISTQAPVRPQSVGPWEPLRGFSGTSRVREDSTDSDGSFEHFGG